MIDRRIRADLCQGLNGNAQEQALRHVREVHSLGDGPARTAGTGSFAWSRTTALSWIGSPSTECERHLLQTTSRAIYHVDLHGNVGTTRNSAAPRTTSSASRSVSALRCRCARRMPQTATNPLPPGPGGLAQREGSLRGLLDRNRNEASNGSAISWMHATLGMRWATPTEFATNSIPMGNKDEHTIFRRYSTGRKATATKLSTVLIMTLLPIASRRSSERYNREVDRISVRRKSEDIDDFVEESCQVEQHAQAPLERGEYAEYDAAAIRRCLYRPYTKQHLYLRYDSQ